MQIAKPSGTVAVAVGDSSPGDYPHQVRQQNEQKERRQVGDESLIAVADDRFCLLADELAGHLGKVLHAAGLLDA